MTAARPAVAQYEPGVHGVGAVMAADAQNAPAGHGTRAIEASGCRGELTIRKRATGEVWLTDSGNVILDAALGTIPAPEDLAERLDSVTALVEHGLFIGIAKMAILATSSGIKTMSV